MMTTQNKPALEKMRYICGRPSILDELRMDDPNTPLSQNFIRTAALRGIAAGHIRFVPVGRRRLVNYSDFLAFINSGACAGEDKPLGTIRRVV